ncbi:MAG: hypothetical protein ACT4OO_05980 [Nitrospiraceae bacterium]
MTRWKSALPLWVTVLALTLGVSSQPLEAQPVSDETRLQVLKQEVDEEAAGRPHPSTVAVLAEQLHVEPKVVEALRRARHGWGELTIRLVLARELTGIDPKTFPTLSDALQRVGELRNTRKNWGAIAQELGVALESIVAGTQHAQQEFRKEIRAGQSSQDRTSPQKR